MGRPTWRGRRTLTLSQHPCRPMSAPPCGQAALPRTGSMPGVPPRAVTAGLGGGGDVTIPRPAGGDQRLWLEQGPGKTEPRLVSTTLGQAAKHLLGLDALPDSRPRPAPTGRRAPHPGSYRARSQELSPRVAGANHKGGKITLLPGAWANGLLATPPPTPGSKEGGPERLAPRGCLDLPTRQRTLENPACRRGSGRNWSRVPGPGTQHQPFPCDPLGLRGWGGR